METSTTETALTHQLKFWKDILSYFITLIDHVRQSNFSNNDELALKSTHNSTIERSRYNAEALLSADYGMDEQNTYLTRLTAWLTHAKCHRRSEVPIGLLRTTQSLKEPTTYKMLQIIYQEVKDAMRAELKELQSANQEDKETVVEFEELMGSWKFA